MVEKEIFLLLASSYRLAYAQDIVNIMCLPKGSTYNLRYKISHFGDISETENSDIETPIRMLKISLDQLPTNSQTINKPLNMGTYNCLIVYLDTDYIKETSIEWDKCFIPIRWGVIKDIDDPEAQVYVNVEVIIGDYYNPDKEIEGISFQSFLKLKLNEFEWVKNVTNGESPSIEKIVKGAEDIEFINKEYNSFVFFVFPLRLNSIDLEKRNYEIGATSNWLYVCEQLLRRTYFKKNTVFIIFKKLINVKKDKIVEITKITNNLYGYKLEDNTFYKMHLVQWTKDETYEQLKEGELKIESSLNRLKIIENKIDIYRGGPYITRYPIFHTNSSYKSEYGLIGIDGNLSFQNTGNNENIGLAPKLIIPSEIKNKNKWGVIMLIFVSILFGIDIINLLNNAEFSGTLGSIITSISNFPNNSIISYLISAATLTYAIFILSHTE